MDVSVLFVEMDFNVVIESLSRIQAGQRSRQSDSFRFCFTQTQFDFLHFQTCRV